MESNALGKLLPKAIATRRRKKAPKEPLFDAVSLPHPHPHGSSSDDHIRSSARSHPRSSTGTGSCSGNSSRDSNNMTDPEETTSLISYCSDPDVLPPGPAHVPVQPSQIGYQNPPSSPVQDVRLKGETQPESIPRPVTYHGAESFIPVDLTVAKTELLQPQPTSSKRSPSPVGRFREVFRPRKTASASSSPERRSELTEPDRRATNKSAPPSSAFQAAPTSAAESAEQPETAPSRSHSQAKQKKPTIDLSANAPRKSPSSNSPPAPVIVNTPATPTDLVPPRTQTSPTKRAPKAAADGPQSSPRLNETLSSGSITTKTQPSRSGSSTSIAPSKVSSITLPPPAPTAKDVSASSTPAASSFFSSMISAAQNAANSLSNTISTSGIGPGKVKPNSDTKDREIKIPEDKSEQEFLPEANMASRQISDQKELAVKTLGQGDLSFSQLGLADAASSGATTNASKFPESVESRHRSDSAPADPSFNNIQDSPNTDTMGLPRPISLYDNLGTGDRSPPPSSFDEGKTGLQRAGSIRSAIGSAKRRARTGSSATGTTVGAAMSSVTGAVVNPSANMSMPKLTGFAVASRKRNRDFHNLFKSVPDDDYLIEDYSCALQREILAHGRLYVSEGHLCFSSNIFGWVTTLVMGFDEIVSVEKRSTALVFKNGLMISTLHAKHIFASFASRDSTYDLIVNIWKLGHPSLRSSLNGVRLEETGGDKTEKVDEPTVDEDESLSESEGASEDGEDIYDEDEEDENTPDTTQAPEPGPPNGDADKASLRKVSGPALSTGSGGEKVKDAAATATGDTDFPGPTTHAPTDCGDAESHFEKNMGEDTIPAPLGKIYNLIFGPPNWMSKFITADQKCTDLQMDDKLGLTTDNRSREFTYVKPLNGPIGPKQTKCVVNEVLDSLDFNKAATVTVSTQSPDVPSGNAFTVKTKYCLSWAENNQTRVLMTCSIEWTGKSWIKGAIEKASFEGQMQYAKELFSALKLAVASRSRSGTITNGVAGKGKKKAKKGKQTQAVSPSADVELSKDVITQEWGVLEPFRPFLGPIVDIVKPILTGNVVYGLLVGLLVATWFGFGWPNRQVAGVGQPYGGPDLGYRYYPDRIAAYEEMWRREESELWEWIDERVGLDRLGSRQDENLRVRKRAVEPRTVEERLREEKMDDREMEEAIRVTEEKLRVLKEVVEKRKYANE